MSKKNYKIICRCPSLNWVMVRKNNNPQTQGWYHIPEKLDASKVRISTVIRCEEKNLHQGVEVFV